MLRNCQQAHCCRLVARSTYCYIRGTTILCLDPNGLEYPTDHGVPSIKNVMLRRSWLVAVLHLVEISYIGPHVQAIMWRLEDKPGFAHLPVLYRCTLLRSTCTLCYSPNVIQAIAEMTTKGTSDWPFAKSSIPWYLCTWASVLQPPR